VRLYVSNLRARTKDDIITKLKGTGLQILREDLAKFEMKYRRKLRLETTDLTILVRSDSKLEDIMQGRASIEGIMGSATFTILNDEVDTVHHAELKPNKQIDRKRLSLLTNIWTSIGASVAPTLRSTRQYGSGPRTVLVGGGQLHLHTVPANAKESPATRG
jgi:hypothetical protein